jgi:hypothetical protein
MFVFGGFCKNWIAPHCTTVSFVSLGRQIGTFFILVLGFCFCIVVLPVLLIFILFVCCSFCDRFSFCVCVRSVCFLCFVLFVCCVCFMFVFVAILFCSSYCVIILSFLLTTFSSFGCIMMVVFWGFAKMNSSSLYNCIFPKFGKTDRHFLNLLFSHVSMWFSKPGTTNIF